MVPTGEANHGHWCEGLEEYLEASGDGGDDSGEGRGGGSRGYGGGGGGDVAI